LSGGGWILFPLLVGGGTLVVISLPARRHPGLRIAAVTLGTIAASSGIAQMAFFVRGPSSLFLLYPMVLGLSVLVWWTWRGPLLFRVLAVVTVNWWMILWVGFLIVTGGGGGQELG
jgi:hypothetical protein